MGKQRKGSMLFPISQRKPVLLVLGTYHMANPGLDVVNFEADDVLSPKRQREIAEVVERLAAFEPTKIAVEVDPQDDQELQKRYQAYLAENYELTRSEVDQIGFRLAKRLGHQRLYPVDWLRDLPVECETVMTFAQEHGQEEFLERAKHLAESLNKERMEIQRGGTLQDLLRHINSPRNLRKDHQAYFWIALGDNYPGAEWVQYWYGRNLKIFVNLTRITESKDERILLIIGAGHAWLLRQFARESGFYQLEDPLKYF